MLCGECVYECHTVEAQTDITVCVCVCRNKGMQTKLCKMTVYMHACMQAEHTHAHTHIERHVTERRATSLP